MFSFLILAIVIIVNGILLLFAPGLLSSISAFLNRKLFDDSTVFKHRIVIALVSIGAGSYLISAYFGYLLF